ncbi:hypothetical protein DL767_009933 [Monosporascus sp. MG133]|nr:hypothetical protein DL767_009933 [Monosporascus sp. MG133]
MDHLSLVDGARQPALSIPFVVKSASDFPYGHGEVDFISFPEHHLRELRFIHPELGPEDCLLSLAQSWLYFGTLTEFFQQPIDSNMFTRLDHNGDRLICTSALREFRSRWVASLPPRSISSASLRQQVGRRCGVLLARATWAYEQFQGMVTEGPHRSLVMFSIKVMLCSLCHTVRVVLFPTPTLDAVLARLYFHPAAVDDKTATDFLLWDYMVQNGWCPYQMNHLLTLHNATSMIYLASIPRRERNNSHENCLRAGCCKASQIDWAVFQPLHTTAGCTCEHVSVDEQQIMAKLEDGHIPLLSCTRSASGDFSIEVIQADTHKAFGTPTFYYAISHHESARLEHLSLAVSNPHELVFSNYVSSLLDFSVQELFALKRSDGYERMQAIILAQQRLPMQLFCFPTTRTGKSNGMEWLPEKPIAPRLSEDAFAHSVKVVKYLCSLRFRDCWEVHESLDAPDYIPTAAVSPGTHPVLTFRRPLRVGSNLIATLPAKAIVIVAVLGLVTAMSLVAIMSFPPARKLFFRWPVITYSVLLFYTCLTALILFYITALLFICARYISTPWIQKSYLTNRLPWHTPYEIQTDRTGMGRTTLLWRLKQLAISPWRSRRNANGLPQDYTDDYNGDIPFLLLNEPDAVFRGTQTFSTLLPSLDHSEVEAFDCVGEEGARTLRMIQPRGLATSPELSDDSSEGQDSSDLDYEPTAAQSGENEGDDSETGAPLAPPGSAYLRDIRTQ